MADKLQQKQMIEKNEKLRRLFQLTI